MAVRFVSGPERTSGNDKNWQTTLTIKPTSETAKKTGKNNTPIIGGSTGTNILIIVNETAYCKNKGTKSGVSKILQKWTR